MEADAARFELEDAQVKAALERLRLALPLGGDMSPAMRSIGRTLKTSTQLRFRSQTAPDGTPWKPSQRATAEGGQTLRLTGRLRNSITYVVTRNRVEIGTNVIYSAIHQLGGYAGRAAGKAGPIRRPFIPARPYLGMSGADKTELLTILTDYIGRAWTL